MAGKGKRPGEKRRKVRRAKHKGAKPTFDRPREWAEQELIGVRAWLRRLKGPESKRFPAGWRRGQIRHYEKRARMLRVEIAASKAADKATEPDPGGSPKAA